MLKLLVFVLLEILNIITEIDHTFSNTTKKEKITISSHLNDTTNVYKHFKSIDNRNEIKEK